MVLSEYMFTIANKIRNSYMLCNFSDLFKMFDEYDVIKFGKYKVDAEHPTIKIDNDEDYVVNGDYIYTLLCGITHGTFEVLVDNGSEKFIYFTDKCKDNAYALYMFYKGYVKLGDQYDKFSGKMYNSLTFSERRDFLMQTTFINKYNVTELNGPEYVDLIAFLSL